MTAGSSIGSERAARRFDDGYEESVTLSNGARVRLRLIRPDDRQLIADGFERLSPASRYRRFHGAKNRLSDEELRYLTDVDGENHFAIGALRELAPGREEGLGVARFIRMTDDPKVAEAAIAVVDDWQHAGLGRVLFDRLVHAARERGVERFRAEVLPENQDFLGMVQSLCDYVLEDSDDDVLHVEIPLPDDTPKSPLYDLFASVARRAASVRMRFWRPE